MVGKYFAEIVGQMHEEKSQISGESNFFLFNFVYDSRYEIREKRAFASRRKT